MGEPFSGSRQLEPKWTCRMSGALLVISPVRSLGATSFVWESVSPFPSSVFARLLSFQQCARIWYSSERRLGAPPTSQKHPSLVEEEATRTERKWWRAERRGRTGVDRETHPHETKLSTKRVVNKTSCQETVSQENQLSGNRCQGNICQENRFARSQKKLSRNACVAEPHAPRFAPPPSPVSAQEGIRDAHASPHPDLEGSRVKTLRWREQRQSWDLNPNFCDCGGAKGACSRQDAMSLKVARRQVVPVFGEALRRAPRIDGRIKSQKAKTHPLERPFRPVPLFKGSKTVAPSPPSDRLRYDRGSQRGRRQVDATTTTNATPLSQRRMHKEAKSGSASSQEEPRRDLRIRVRFQGRRRGNLPEEPRRRGAPLRRF